VLNFVYYPVSAIMWFWHKVFGYVFGEASGVAWALAVVFLVFSLRALLYKPFVHQVRSMRKMQEFAPEMQKLRAKYGNDKQKLTAEMQKLQSQQGVNPLGGCLPVLVQVPVFIGLFHVLREFEPGKTENYVFGASEVESFNAASLFGAKLGAWVTMGSAQLQALGTSIPEMLIVMVPLMIAAGIFTHITARHSVARQTEAQLANPQAAIMNKLMLYVFPIGVVVGAPFLPLAVLIYWVANNLWTLGQQYVVYRKIDAEEAEKKTQAVAERQARAPRPGQKPMRPEAAARSGNAGKNPDAKNPAAKTADGKTPGAKPVTPRASRTDGQAAAQPAGTTGESADDAAPANGASPNGAGATNPAAKGPVANDPGTNGAGTKGTGASATRGRSGASRPPARRPRRRR
jgi:YidC/Oxa1 family membrane protein insertase